MSKHKEVPTSGDNSEQHLSKAVQHGAEDAFRNELQKGGDKHAKHDAKELVKDIIAEDKLEHLSPKQIEAQLAKITSNIRNTLFERDPGTGTNLMERMAANAPDLYKSFSETLGKSSLAPMITGENMGPNYNAKLTDKNQYDQKDVHAFLEKINPPQA